MSGIRARSTPTPLLLTLAALAALAGCGSSSKRTQSKPPASPVVHGVSAQSVEHALLARGIAPRPTAAVCRPSTPAERATAPFGHTSLPLFTCELTITGQQAAYVVQVLPNGCFVAERRRPGAAVYGCGVKRS